VCRIEEDDCSSVVNFKGTATTDENKGIGYYGSYYCKVKVEELLSNPSNRLKVGNEYIVCYGNRSKSIKTGDKVEVYGEYYHTCGPLQWVGQIIAFDNDYYVKKISSESLSINVWTDKSEYEIGETVTIYYQTNKKCTAKLTVTKPDGTQVVVGGPNEIPACTRSKSATIGYPTGRRTVVFEAWAGDEYKKATCYFDVVEEAKEVKFRGKILADHPVISFYSFDVKIDKILDDPTGNLQKGETVNVYGHRDGPAQVDDVTVGDKVEVYGEYRGYADGPVISPYEQIFLSDWDESSSDHYVKKIEEPDLIIQDISWSPSNPKQGDTVTINVKTKNQGSVSAGAFYVCYYVDGSYYDRDYVNSLSAGSTTTTSFSWTADCGSHSIKAVADCYDAVTESNEGNNARTEYINISAEWSFMVYMDADNGLEWLAVSKKLFNRTEFKGDFYEMSEIGSTEDVNVVVQLDRQGSEYTKRFQITKGSTIENSGVDIGEVNMGDPDTLYEFITWTKENYPAQHYCIVLWDHGAGWEWCCKDNTSNDDKLTLQEIKQAFKQAGIKFDVLVFDACIMGNIETVYQLKDYANTFVVSEETLSCLLSPYDAILQELTKKPSMSCDELGKIWVDNYIESWKKARIIYEYEKKHDHNYMCLNFSEYTQSKMDSIYVAKISNSVDTLGIKLMNYWNNPNYRSEIRKARENAEEFAKKTSHEHEYVDIYSLCQQIKESDVPNDFKNAAGNVINLIDQGIYSQNGPAHANSKGLSIYFPLKGSAKYKDEYDQLDFAKDTKWDDWLKIYLKEEKEPDLVVQDIWWSPSNPKEGDTVTFIVKVKNQGSWSAGTSTVKYYIDGSYVGSDTVPSLSVGSTSTQTFTWKANKCGNVKVKAVADATNAVDESNEGNNRRVETVHIECLPKEKPDLIISDISMNPLSPKQGDEVEFTVTVKNIGKGTAKKSTTRIYLINGDKQRQFFLDFLSCPPLKPGATYTYTKNAKIEDCGEYGFKAFVDVNKEVDESNEENNCRVASFTVPCPKKEGTLVVNVYSIDGKPAAEVKGTTTVELIKSGEVSPTAKQNIDDKSRVTFTEIPAGNYYINVYHNPQLEQGSKESWGKRKDIAITAGTTTTIDFHRYNPYIDQFYAEKKSIESNTPVRINVGIKVPSNCPDADTYVKALVILRDENGHEVYRNESDDREVQKGDRTTFSFSYTPTNEGTYSGLAKAYIVGGGELCTDNWGWMKVFNVGAIAVTPPEENIFDTGTPSNPYPSIAGTHTGTIMPNQTITVNKLYTYPCAGTGGHTESIELYDENGNLIASGNWNGYQQGDWHNITFDNPVVLLPTKTYKYTIRTGSYPQIIHKQNHTTLDGSLITCTKFIDANGKVYYDWIPAIRLFSEEGG